MKDSGQPIIFASMNFKLTVFFIALNAFFLLISNLLFSQERTDHVQYADSTRILKEVIVKPYFSAQPLLRSTGSISVIDQQALAQHPSTSLVSAMNTVAGIRMEERSPGSYRLSIRGSLLRSPFGVRNIKIYFDDFPLTDAGGNTYLNALDAAGLSQIQVLKGPNSSIYGANSGGVVLIQPQNLSDFHKLSLKLEGGAYGSFRENMGYNWSSEKYSINLTQAYQRSDGYRDHSGMNRKYVQTFQNFNYHARASLKALLFYSDLHYNTPGGLNAVQFATHPKASRPAAGSSPAAADQQAGIYSKTGYGGLSHSWEVTDQLKHVIAGYASYTDFKNPFITNYEKRKESTVGMRSYLEYLNKQDHVEWKFNIGAESMQTKTDFNNYDNNRGVPGALQAADDLKASANFAFANLNIDLASKLLLEASTSVNLFKYMYKSVAPIAIPSRQNTFDLQFMPRLGLSYLMTKLLSLRGSISKGYSPPTLAEVRGSNNVINTELQPEYGWNYEGGLRYHISGQRLMVDVNGFYYHLTKAISRRVDRTDTEYFVNTGGTRQLGIESQLVYFLMPDRLTGFFRRIQLQTSYTLSRFKFDNYLDSENDYSGNSVTGVPKTVVVSSASIHFSNQYRLFIQHNYTSAIPLNDANTVFAEKYHLIQLKISKIFFKSTVPIEIYAGGDNLLNQQYSLGNDLNAFGGRYFNPAAKRNFYGGVAMKF